MEDPFSQIRSHIQYIVIKPKSQHCCSNLKKIVTEILLKNNLLVVYLVCVRLVVVLGIDNHHGDNSTVYCYPSSLLDFWYNYFQYFVLHLKVENTGT